MSMTLSGLSCGAKGIPSDAPCKSALKVLWYFTVRVCAAHVIYSEVDDTVAQICGNCGRWHLGEDGDASFFWLHLAKLS